MTREAGEELLQDTAEAPNPESSEPLTFKVTPARYTGRPILSPLTPSLVDQGATVRLIGDGPYINSIERDGNGPYTVTALVPIAGNEPGELNQENLRAAGTAYPVEITDLYLEVPEGAIPAGGVGRGPV